MDPQAIGSVTSAGVDAPPQSRAQDAQPAVSDKADKAVAAVHRHAAEAAIAETPVPQRDPRSLQYQVDGTTHRVVATIVDEGTKTVVRQIPDAEVLRIAKEIDRMQGFLVEDRA